LAQKLDQVVSPTASSKPSIPRGSSGVDRDHSWVSVWAAFVPIWYRGS